ncbi:MULTISPECIES: SDR family NAD(P)-dependent oxidoreductase [unclassified Sporolactobacillus]|uniref:SDR family NAD(P)-dependent oxidoreductase n=1 Tax=unclassified Sporolactobacillus TaxID=2628533 RepID=UPI002367641C|nr:SDR family oxidoreductase [Sporolactobacillus sp. CQH2019]MDD9148588.1 SDR family oxidoreductase [Sporolactobacillus sp. CQH2019]
MLDKKVVVITGASSGVGRETALLCAEKGAETVLIARNSEKLKNAERKIRERGDSAGSFTLDVRNCGQVEKVFGEIAGKYGRIDVLVNCAGIGQFAPLVSTDMEDVKKMFSVNVIGLMACTKAVLPLMIRQKSGQIVNVASIAGKLATPKSTVYAATKHAVLGFSNGLRMEVEDKGIRVTAVNPGPIRTAFFETADPAGTYAARVGPFMLDPKTVARRIVQAVEKKKREISLPWYMGLAAKIYQLFPVPVEKIGGRWFRMK